MAIKRITKRTVDTARPAVGRTLYMFDRDLKGFGLKVTPQGVRTYFVQFRTGKGRRAPKRRYFIGRHGSPWTPDMAREEADRILSRVQLGDNPHAEREADRGALTVADLCQQYLAKVEVGEVRTRRGLPKKASTVAIDRGRIARHILPPLGTRLVKDLTREDVKAFLAAVAVGKTATAAPLTRNDDRTIKPRGRVIVKGGEGTARRTIGLLGGILQFAVEQGIAPHNPTHGLKLSKDRKRDRWLDAEEYRALSAALAEGDNGGKGVMSAARAAVRLIALTGLRRGEALQLRWADIDAKRRVLRLTDSKTGAGIRPLGKAALALLEGLPRRDPVFVFPAASGGKPLGGLPHLARAVFAKAGLADATLHTLRHSLATVANALGYTESTIAALLGHARHSITARYAHNIDSVLLAAADRVTQHIDDSLAGRSMASAEVVALARPG